jgi:plastocyanin
VRIPASIPAAAVAVGAFIFANPAMAAPQSVDVVNHGFTPPDVTVNAGDAVTWNFQESGHDVDIYQGPETAKSAKTPSGGTWSHTFATPGKYSYICDYHSGMQGTVTVLAAPSGGGSTGGGGSAGGGSTGGGGSAGGGSTGGGGSAGGAGSGSTANPLTPSLGTTAVDAAAPSVRSRGFKANHLNLQLTEDSRLVVRFVRVGAPGHVVHKRITRAKKGTVALPLNRWMRAGTYRVHVLAFDAGGNVSRPIRLFNIHVR